MNTVGRCCCPSAGTAITPSHSTVAPRRRLGDLTPIPAASHACWGEAYRDLDTRCHPQPSHLDRGRGLLRIAIVLLWTWLNLWLFPPSRTTRTSAAKATFGERLWLNRDRVPVPVHHRIVPRLLTGVAAMGFAVAVGGALAKAIWLTLLGTVLSYAGKLWFCDCMVWPYEEMKDVHPEYRQWLRCGL